MARLLEDFKSEMDLVTLTQSGMEDGLAEAHQALSQVLPAVFLDPSCRAVWEAMRRIYQRGELPEIYAIRAELQALGKVKDEGDWIKFFTMITEGVRWGSPAGLVRQLLGLWQRREAAKVLDKGCRAVQDQMEDHLQVIQDSVNHLLGIMGNSDDEAEAVGDEILKLVQDEARFSLDQEAGKLAHFGLERVDESVTAGGGEFVIIAARPGKGKTALAIQTICTTAEQGIPSLFVSLELPRIEALARIASWFTLTRSGSFWAGRYQQDATMGTLLQKQATMDRIHVWASPSQAPWSRIEAKIRGAVLRKGVKLVVLDYFGLIGKPAPQKGSNIHAEASALSASIRRLAQELKICIVVLSQLNREGSSEPNLEHLRETGSLEQDAQVVLALWGAKPSEPVDLDPFGTGHDLPAHAQQEATMLKILKNRNGASGLRVQVDFDGAVNHMRERISETGRP